MLSHSFNTFNTECKTINYLEEKDVFIKPIPVTLGTKKVIRRIVGDNLGLNQLLGFSTSFRAQYFCRICTVNSADAKILVSEKKSLLRNRINYNLDVNCLKNNSKLKSSHGVKEECIFDPVFDFIELCSIDPTHDLNEGTFKRSLAIIIKALMELKYFDLEILNRNIDLLVIDQASGINKPPKVDAKILEKAKKIAEAFPGEDANYWYTTEDEGGPGGYFHSSIKNQRHRLKKEREVTPPPEIQTPAVDQDILTFMEYLESHPDCIPLDKTIEAWNGTECLRKKDLDAFQKEKKTLKKNKKKNNDPDKIPFYTIENYIEK
ncbi:hypothetical protein HCN44_010352 [Aphidius gifuensis]|uniref:Uncharacterized protein n=1 Tax=Aphidius gifuensis TaxID=684658 RepID=A0A834XY27_APHGI|nr:hypothetical protein HCN44_010352 [Aphidius gifuensis]